MCLFLEREWKMTYSNYVLELFQEFEQRSLQSNMQQDSKSDSEDTDAYYDDIFDNWIDLDLGISFNDACDAKDSGWTSKKFKNWVKNFKEHGGGNNFMRYVFEFDPEKAAQLSIHGIKDFHIDIV